jgi:putative redox protein
MSTKVDVTWKENMAFEASVNNHTIHLDIAQTGGGADTGPRPKPLMLVALGGCTGMDVVSILKKMRVEPDYFSVQVEGEQTDEHPKTYHTIRITYFFKGADLPMDKLEKAVALSQERYCGVSAMLAKAARLEHRIVVE